MQVNGDLDRALRDLKKMIARDGIMVQLKERAKGAKPSVRRRLKSYKAERRRMKLNGKKRNFNIVQ